MARGGLGLFFLEAAAGAGVLLLFFPVRDLGKGFFSLHAAMMSVFLLFAVLVRPAGLPAGITVAAVFLAAGYTLAAHAGRAAAGRPLLALGAAAGLWALVRVALIAPRAHGDAWTVAGAILG